MSPADNDTALARETPSRSATSLTVIAGLESIAFAAYKSAPNERGADEASLLGCKWRLVVADPVP